MPGYIGGRVIAATVFGLLLPILAIIVRVWVKIRTEPRLRSLPEDYFAYAALLFKIALDICGIILLRNGLGAHVSSVPPTNLVTFAKTQYSGNYLYTACVACVKLSILFQYHRILGHASRPYFRWQVRALMGMVVIWTICIFMMSVTICIPLQRFWNPSVPGGCLNITDFYYGMQIPNILTDIFIVVCPVYEVYSQYFRQGRGLGRSKSSMIVALGLMFALGFITFIFDIVRLVVFLQIDKGSSDVTYDLVNPAVWTTIEPAIAIVAICLPSCRKLFMVLRQDKKGWTQGEELDTTAVGDGGQTEATNLTKTTSSV